MLERLFGSKLSKVVPTKDDVARMLHTNPEALAAFEKEYEATILTETPDDLFQINAKQAADQIGASFTPDEELDGMINTIVDDFISETPIYRYKRSRTSSDKPSAVNITLPTGPVKNTVSKDMITKYEPALRPQCTTHLQRRDIGQHSADMLLMNLYESQNTKRPAAQRRQFYHMFRQGLDILDLDPITYEILGMNRNSMGYWLPKIIDAIDNDGFFKIPDTTIIKVPMNMLQLTRTDYETITGTTFEIVNRFCQKVFDLADDGNYFLKTGTYSSKFDFRNCRVCDPKEIREIGQYLLFIQYQASQMAAPLNIDPKTGQPKSIYGVSTTNEWVVREYIPDTEANPCIYKGLPLHTEYRVFVDFDTKEVLAVCNYWDPETMKKRFGEGADESIHDYHDYATYKSHEDVLTGRFEQNKKLVADKIMDVINTVTDLTGQWSIDIMQNGNDFWLIDMAVAENSAFYNKIPDDMRRPIAENWIPDLSDKTK